MQNLTKIFDTSLNLNFNKIKKNASEIKTKKIKLPTLKYSFNFYQKNITFIKSLKLPTKIFKDKKGNTLEEYGEMDTEIIARFLLRTSQKVKKI